MKYLIEAGSRTLQAMKSITSCHWQATGLQPRCLPDHVGCHKHVKWGLAGRHWPEMTLIITLEFQSHKMNLSSNVASQLTASALFRCLSTGISLPALLFLAVHSEDQERHSERLLPGWRQHGVVASKCSWVQFSSSLLKRVGVGGSSGVDVCLVCARLWFPLQHCKKLC